MKTEIDLHIRHTAARRKGDRPKRRRPLPAALLTALLAILVAALLLYLALHAVPSLTFSGSITISPG